MVQLTLPKNSRMTTGKTWPRPEGASNVRKVQIYRFNPDDGKNPSLDTYFVDLDLWPDGFGRVDQDQKRN